MSDVVLRAEGLSKRYRLGRREQYSALRDTLSRALSAPGRLARGVLRGERTAREEQAELWALRDVSFEVRRGEVVGIIGRNGAGKSTLLKILSRITAPTAGRVALRGRVGSLLEVGTGFHPELTGRENILLNGAILGMHRAEILRKFDAIVAFAEVERFIDTPVKHYSSGMYMRLAFAVAAHLEPEILVVDEVLAVGDAQFQKKCLGKMGEVAREGRTVLFVSHQLSQVRRLCERTLWLEAGRVRQLGATMDVVGAYESSATTRARGASAASRAGAQFVGWRLLGESPETPHRLSRTEQVQIGFTLEVARPVRNGLHGVALYNADNLLLWSSAVRNFALELGTHELVHTLDTLPLQPGNYTWLASCFDEHGELDYWYAVPEMLAAVEPRVHMPDNWQGILNLRWGFEQQQIGDVAAL